MLRHKLEVLSSTPSGLIYKKIFKKNSVQFIRKSHNFEDTFIV